MKNYSDVIDRIIEYIDVCIYDCEADAARCTDKIASGRFLEKSVQRYENEREVRYAQIDTLEDVKKHILDAAAVIEGGDGNGND